MSRLWYWLATATPLLSAGFGVTRLRGILLRTALTVLAALRRNKLRSGLTTLGIIIGAFAVVAKVALGNGTRASIESQVAGLAQDML